MSVLQADYATNTNAFYGNLNSCVVKADSDIDCATNVKDGLEKLSEYIQGVGNKVIRVLHAFNLFYHYMYDSYCQVVWYCSTMTYIHIGLLEVPMACLTGARLQNN